MEVYHLTLATRVTAFSRQMQIQVSFKVHPSRSKVVSKINRNSVLSAKVVLERVADHVAV